MTNAQMEEKEEEAAAFLYAMQLSTLSILPMILKVAMELGVLDLLTKVGGYLSTDKMALDLNLSNPGAPSMLDRILCLLTSYNILECSSHTHPDNDSITRVYRATLACKYLAKDKDGLNALGPFLSLAQDKVMVDSMRHMKDMVVEGRSPFMAAHGVGLFEYFARDSRFKKVFFDAVSSHSLASMKNILDSYDGFEGAKTVVDVGGGVGACLHMIVSKYPQVRGINFDLPHVVSAASSFPGVEHVGGNMFHGVPSGDIIFLKCVLHSYDDDSCVKLLENCWKALPTNGKVIVVELIIPAVPESTLTAKTIFLMDMNMLSHTEHGRERSEQEFYSLGKKAQFAKFNVACTVSEISIMEFTK